eukprot:579030-Prymnesium_polylepis.1
MKLGDVPVQVVGGRPRSVDLASTWDLSQHVFVVGAAPVGQELIVEAHVVEASDPASSVLPDRLKHCVGYVCGATNEDDLHISWSYRVRAVAEGQVQPGGNLAHALGCRSHVADHCHVAACVAVHRGHEYRALSDGAPTRAELRVVRLEVVRHAFALSVERTRTELWPAEGRDQVRRRCHGSSGHLESRTRDRGLGQHSVGLEGAELEGDPRPCALVLHSHALAVRRDARMDVGHSGPNVRGAGVGLGQEPKSYWYGDKFLRAPSVPAPERIVVRVHELDTDPLRQTEVQARGASRLCTGTRSPLLACRR